MCGGSRGWSFAEGEPDALVDAVSSSTSYTVLYTYYLFPISASYMLCYLTDEIDRSAQYLLEVDKPYSKYLGRTPGPVTN